MAKHKPRMKIYTFRLEDKYIAFLDRWAKREGKTRSEILRATLEAWDRAPDLIDQLPTETILTLKDPHGS
jgi:hypothetical protein